MTAPIRSQAGRFKPVGKQDTEFTRRWVFPQDTDAKSAIELFDQIKSMPFSTAPEARAALKMIRRLNRLLSRMGLQ